MRTWSKSLSIIITFLVAIPAGFLFDYLHVPMPWMLGPIFATLLYNSIGNNNRAYCPLGLRDLALIVIGYSMGRGVTVETARQILVTLPAIVIVTVLTILFSVALGYFIHRRTGITLSSGILGSMPGGLPQMVLLTEEIKDSDLTVVSFMQTIRLLAIVFIVPFIATFGIAHVSGTPLSAPFHADHGPFLQYLPAIAMAPIGAWLAFRLKLSSPFLMGPIFGTAAAVLCGFPALPVPRVLLNAAQIFFGIYMGIGITLKSLRRLGKVLPYAIGSAVTLVAFAFFLGYGLTFLMQASLLTTFLGTAPGGIAEMGITAIALHADISTVTAFHLFRLFTILLAVPPLLKWRLNR